MVETGALRYNSVSLVYLQVFTVDRPPREEFRKWPWNRGKAEPHAFPFPPADNPIDRQIFVTGGEKPVERFKLPSFDFTLNLEDPDVTVSGTLFVEVSLFFDRTVSLSYRMMIDGKVCKATEPGVEPERRVPLTTDHLISLASLNLGAEHWSCDEEGSYNTINLDVADIHVSNLRIGAGGEPLDKPCALKGGRCFEEVQARYKRHITRYRPALDVRDTHYAYIDVWEDVGHTDDHFARVSEPEIITHIYEKHRRELVGLLSLYPYEWPYRTEESFDDVCGTNVAIDTDDLILLNQNLCVVFGTYGLRGKDSPTDWAAHLRVRQEYHVSWPEYLLILEMVLAKKYSIAAASELFLGNTCELSSLRHTRNAIERNAHESILANNLLLRLDAVKYSRYVSHKIMFERTTRRLEVEKEMKMLSETLANTDKSLFNISEMRKLKHSARLNIVLGIISAASLFGILFQSIEVPFLRAIGYGELSGTVGMTIISLTLLLIILCIFGVFVLSIRNNRLR